MADLIYTPSFDSDNNAYVDGPAPGGNCSYHGGYLYPDSRFANKKDALKTATMMNMAYAEGYARAQADMRNLLGIKK